MIAVDTNILLRYLLADDDIQYKKAYTLIEEKSPVLITDVVLAETLWTLTGKRYNLDKDNICNVVRGLIGDGAFLFESNQVVWSALNNYEESISIRGKSLDFVDTLILNKSYLVAESKGVDLSGYYSFDKAVEQLVEQLKRAKKPK